MRYTDYIIVGGGISGSVLSFVLMQHGASVHVFDMPKENKSSAVAAGLWNPIVLKRLKKVWKADEMMEQLHLTYPELEQWTGHSFFDIRPIRRIFHNPGEQNTWLGLTSNPAFEPYLDDRIEEVPEGIVAAYGSAMTKGTGRVRVNDMMEAVRGKLKEEQRYTEALFDWNDVVRDEEGVRYGDLRAHAIISCEGVQAALSERALEVRGLAPVKGEVIKVELDKDLKNECIHQGHFMLGEPNQQAFVGATYAWEGFEEGPTAAKRKELEDHIDHVWNRPYTVIDHSAGIRPAVKDRRPLVGTHPEFKHTYLFNGMGSRAVLMAPWLATRMAEHLVYGVPLPQEVLPERFWMA
ncbi:MAG: hypothetical protein RL754_1124 [Bacteroidota bacterium]|jgi:glycine/D-amino acid oxidase-like deaminating enzyme